ncbi:MAG: MFS transporter [Chloroflexi bacterium]|nr:MFS transporter [Chloroflexota bacterium]
MIKSRTSPAIYALIAEGFLMRIAFGIIAFTLPLYGRHLGLSLAEAGLLVALTDVVKVALKPLMGWISDRVGLKRALVTALGLRSLVSFLLTLAMAPWHLYAIRALHGVSTSVRDPAINALIAEHGDEKAIASTFAWYFTAKSLAGSLGKAAGGALLTLTASNFSLVFLITWAFSSLTLPVVMLLVPGARRKREASLDAEVKRDSDTADEPEGPGGRHSLRRKVIAVSGLGFLISVTNSLIGIYPILATEYAGMTEAQAGAVYLASAVVALVAGPVFGWLADRFGRKPTIAARSVANAGSSLLYLFIPNWVGFTTGKVMDDAGRAGFRPAWGALKADVSRSDRSQRARLMGIMDVGDDAGDMVGPVAGGLLWDLWGITGLMGTRIVLAIATEVYGVLVAWRVHKDPAPQRVLQRGRAGAERPPPVEQHPPN